MREALVKIHGDPREGGEYWRRVMPINYVGEIGGPVQIHHGTADLSVPVFMSEHLAQAMAKADKRHEYYLYDGGDHNFTGAARGPLLERVLGLFQQHL